jgi:archaemetzincin
VLSRRAILQGVIVGLAGCERTPAIGPRSADPRPRARAASDREVRAWAFDPAVFHPLPPPAPGDWLAEHEEPGQTVRQFLASAPNRVVAPRDTIVVQPLGELTGFRGPDLAVQADFLGRYFGLAVRTRKRLDPDTLPLSPREHLGHRQLLTPAVLDALRLRLPEDAYCLLAVTAIDLYPEPSWNFVFGQANLRERVGVFSLARYDAAFFGQPPSDRGLVARRTLQVLAHEVGHMFGMHHCIAYACVMNGSNHQEESDRTPLHLCAVCLEKLHRVARVPLVARYRGLHEFYLAQGLEPEARWVADRLASAPA